MSDMTMEGVDHEDEPKGEPRANLATEIKQEGQRTVRPRRPVADAEPTSPRPPRAERPKPIDTAPTSTRRPAQRAVNTAPREVDPTKPAINSRQGKSMRATREHVGREAFGIPGEPGSGVPMEDATHYFILVPNKSRDIATYRRKGYKIDQGHELNSEDEVVMKIEKSVKDAKYDAGVKRIRGFQNDGLAEEGQEGVERTRAEGGRPISMEKALDRLPDEGDESDEAENDEYEDG